jgi:hypothetical protein
LHTQGQNLEDGFQRLAELLREAQVEALPRTAPKEAVVPEAARLARIHAKKAQSQKKSARSSRGGDD